MSSAARRMGSARVRARSRWSAGIAAALVAAIAGAGDARAASLFSLNGPGETIDLASGRGRALGGVSASLEDPMRIGLDNPALLAGVNRFSFSTVFVAERRSSESAAVSETFTDGSFPSIVFGLPISRLAVIGVGLLREQSVFVNPLVVENIEEPARHSLRFQRDGDLFRVPLGVGRAFGDRVTAGFSFDYWYGEVEEERTVDFANTDFRDTRDISSEEIDGTGWSAGVIARPTPRVNAGFRYRGRKVLNGTQRLTTADGGTTTSKAQETVPASWAVGTEVIVHPRLGAVLELRRDLWEGEEGTSPPAGGYVDATRVGGGLELLPVEGSGGLASIPWRVGFRRAGWAFRDNDGDEIGEWFLSGGTTFPLGRDVGVLDLFVEYGRRGSVDENDLEEGILRFGAGFAAGEPWRKPPKGRRGGVPTSSPGY